MLPGSRYVVAGALGLTLTLCWGDLAVAADPPSPTPGPTFPNPQPPPPPTPVPPTAAKSRSDAAYTAANPEPTLSGEQAEWSN